MKPKFGNGTLLISNLSTYVEVWKSSTYTLDALGLVKDFIFVTVVERGQAILGFVKDFISVTIVERGLAMSLVDWKIYHKECLFSGTIGLYSTRQYHIFTLTKHLLHYKNMQSSSTSIGSSWCAELCSKISLLPRFSEFIIKPQRTFKSN